MLWLILVIISAVSGSLSKVLQKVLLKGEDSDPVAFGFIFQLLVAILFLLYALLTQSLHFPMLAGLIFNIVVMSLFYGLGNLFTFKAFKLAEASEVSVIFASSTLWSVVAALFLLGEKLNSMKIVGMLLVIAGLIAINYRKSKWKVNKGHTFAFLAAMLFGIAFTNDAFIITRFKSVASYMIIAFALPAFTTLVFRPKSIKNVPYFFNKKIIVRLLICGFFYFLAALTIFEAYKRGGLASIISPISESSLVFTVIISYIFLREKNHVWNKVLGTILTLGGILLLI